MTTFPATYRAALGVRRVLDLARALYACAGTFTHRGVRFWHVGVLLDQQVAAATVDGAVAVLIKAGYSAGKVEAALARVAVHVVPERVAFQGGRVEQFARWRGGIFDRGEVRLRYTDDWPQRLADCLRALLLTDLTGEAPRTSGGGVY